MFDIGVIPAAGSGLRLFPYTEHTPKALLRIGGKSLLQRNIEIMRDDLKVKEVIILIGHLGEQISDTFGDGSHLGIKISYIKCLQVKDGLAKGLLLVKDRVTSHFPVILGDEIYLNANHKELVNMPLADVICGVKLTGDTTLIKKNYSLTIENNQITSLTEKPTAIENNYLGCGTYIFSPAIFDYIESCKPSSKTHRVELTDVINNIANDKKMITPFFLKGEYRNINTADDFNSATYLYRNSNINNHKVSLIIPAYNEEASIGYVIEEFIALKEVDEIIVAENCSSDNTAAIAKKAGATVISKPYAGYGDALRAGMAAATGDIFILVEADASFSSKDLPKFLAYLADADMVIGTRTTQQLIQQGANMGSLLRWGNVLAAKVLEALFWFPHMPRFTDLGCTYRGIWRDSYETILPNLSDNGPAFSPEMMVEIMRANRKVIEIPVTYRPRIGGESKHSGSFFHIVKTGSKMMWLILKRRFAKNS